MVSILQFSFSFSYTRPKTPLYTFLPKMFIFFLPLFVSAQVSDADVKVLFVSAQVSDADVKVLSIIVFFSLNFSFFRYIFISKKCYSIKYVLLAFFILFCKSTW